MSDSLGFKPFSMALTVIILATGTAVGSQSGTIEILPGTSGNWWGDPGGPNNTGFQLYNGSPTTSTVRYEFDFDNALLRGEAPPGFVMLDGTLEIATDIPAGAMRCEVRMEYDRARLRPLNIRERKLTLMRLKREHPGRLLWRPLARALRERNLTATRRTADADFMLGHYGLSTTHTYVWGVIDAGGVYAVGAPEPASLVCLAGGTGLLLLGRRRR